MSSGSLSTLLVQRLETALGVTLSTQGQLQSARSRQSVLPTGAVARPEALENATKAQQQAGNFQAVAQSVQASLGHRPIQGSPVNSTVSQQALGQAGKHTAQDAVRNPAESTSTRWSSAARSMVALLGQMPEQAAPLGNTNHAPIIPKNPKELLSYLSRPAEPAALSGRSLTGGVASQAAGAPSQATNANIPLKEDALRALGSSLFASIIRETLTREIARPGLSYEATLWRMLRSNGNLKELASHPKAQLLKEQQAQQQAARQLSILSVLTQGKAEATPAPPPLSGALASLVQQQLEMHQQQRIVWQGEAWQGAAMTWEIQKDNPQAFAAQQAGNQAEDEQNDAASEQAPGPEQEAPVTPWSTTLTLNLPMLGKIQVMVQIINKHVQAQYQVIDNPELKDRQSTASLLLQRMPEFTNRLQALGLQTHSFEVFTDPGQWQADQAGQLQADEPGQEEA
ncbi:flagellar hook-length control protein FliK [Advenella sp. WQ 585]|uniref:Flagellar hook-length control protein FliK n=1 Tax=Advenella mandrilli TaxID=2800330 RepID=A0ABS1ED68_9BURK|nr:flagellar hook-length control protein FliK [Advenella mandrilli]MBK1781566.1 flagellar hook-length control protein FliK [Advenella mandrilli]